MWENNNLPKKGIFVWKEKGIIKTLKYEDMTIDNMPTKDGLYLYKKEDLETISEGLMFGPSDSFLDAKSFF
jgi:hypothetical protein